MAKDEDGAAPERDEDTGQGNQPCRHPHRQREKIEGVDTGDWKCPDCGATWPHGAER
jgi:hypothetical protein